MDLKNKLSTQFNHFIQDSNVLNLYVFGSHVYGTNHKDSDIDLILVVKEFFDSENVDTYVYTENQFQNLLNNGEIQMLECFFSPLDFILKETVKFELNQNREFSEKLRISISTITSNSWVKGKKKLIIAGDYDLNLALKSVFHSLRIIDFAIQISENKKIINYTNSNWILIELKKLSSEFQRIELWNKIDEKFRKLFNEKSSQFKKLNPKNIQEISKKQQIQNLLLEYGINNSELIEKLLEIK